MTLYNDCLYLSSKPKFHTNKEVSFLNIQNSAPTVIFLFFLV